MYGSGKCVITSNEKGVDIENVRINQYIAAVCAHVCPYAYLCACFHAHSRVVCLTAELRVRLFFQIGRQILRFFPSANVDDTYGNDYACVGESDFMCR